MDENSVRQLALFMLFDVSCSILDFLQYLVYTKHMLKPKKLCWRKDCGTLFKKKQTAFVYQNIELILVDG